MKFECKCCLVDSNHPFSPSFINGICNACLKQEGDEIGKLKLKKIFANRNLDGAYDCIIPLKGTPEDFYVVKEVIQMGLYPLCIFVNSYFSNDIAWKNLHSLIHKYDVELKTFNPNLFHYKQMVKYSLRRFSDIMTPHKLLVYNYAMTIAESLKIKLIVSGENQINEATGKYIKQKIPECTAWSIIEHDVHTTANNFFGPSLELPIFVKNQYNPYKLNTQNTQWFFLSDFINWDQLKQDYNELNNGAYGQVEDTTFDFCHRAGSSVFYRFHDLLRFKKFGSIKVTDQLSREIRKGRICKIEAKNLNDQYIVKTLNTDRVMSVVDEFCTWLNLTKEASRWLIKHKMPHAFESDCRIEVNSIEIYSKILNIDIDLNKLNIHNPVKNYCIYEKGVQI